MHQLGHGQVGGGLDLVVETQLQRLTVRRLPDAVAVGIDVASLIEDLVGRVQVKGRDHQVGIHLAFEVGSAAPVGRAGQALAQERNLDELLFIDGIVDGFSQGRILDGRVFVTARIHIEDQLAPTAGWFSLDRDVGVAGQRVIDFGWQPRGGQVDLTS